MAVVLVLVLVTFVHGFDEACALNPGAAFAKKVSPPIDKTEPPHYTTWHHFAQSSGAKKTKKNRMKKIGINESAGRQAK